MDLSDNSLVVNLLSSHEYAMAGIIMKRSRWCLLWAVSVLLALECYGSTQQPKRAVAWWWDAPENATDPAVDGMLNFVKENKVIVTTLIMRCGIYTCNRSPANRYNCTNNGGRGGKLVGTLMPACQRVLPILKQLGVRAELWLGEDDSIVSAHTLFANSEEFANDLIAVTAQYPSIVGFNLDLESQGTAEDNLQYAEFLGTVTEALSKAKGGPIRFSADVSCAKSGSGWSPLISNCSILGNSGVDRIMNMGTYNSKSFEGWYYSLMTPALEVPRNKLGAGLGCWIDYRTNNTWAVTAISAEQRICVLMNQSVQEIDMFVLKQGNPVKEQNFPESFWIPNLERYMRGGGCIPDIPKPPVCPNAIVGPANSWVPGDDQGCCISFGHRGTNLTCNESCAQAECAKAKMYWKPENYSSHPYECCQAPPTMEHLKYHNSW
eukprot:m.237650 g.237650  ORF g.237650 m.237650 type:complete len:435 (+) comp16057_c0_seq35:117-1421(+)